MDFRKAQVGINDIVPVVIILGVAGVVSGAGVLVLSKFQTQAVTDGENLSYYIIGNGSAGINQLANFYPTIGIVIAAVIIIGLIITAFRFNN